MSGRAFWFIAGIFIPLVGVAIALVDDWIVVRSLRSPSTETPDSDNA